MLNKTTIYAIKALIFLGKLPAGQYAGSAEIARRIHLAPNYLGKLLKKLAEKGIVVSQKGMRGGFKLKKSPKKIPLYALVAVLDDIQRWTACPLHFTPCSHQHPCLLHSRWKNVRKAYIDFLKKTTIADLMLEEDGKYK